jgi:hypothetical protein
MRKTRLALASILVCLAGGGTSAQTDDSGSGAGTQVEPASEPGLASRHRWHLPRKRERDPLGHEDPPPADEDWNPLSGERAPAPRLPH